ncbi:hypothetical protein JCM10207_000747 [Rhodosporidiobolus poonsookiae]
MVVELSTLKLVEREERPDAPDSELGEDWVDEVAVWRARGFKDVRFAIIDPTHGVLGSLHFWLFNTIAMEEGGDVFRECLDDLTSTWGSEVTDTGNVAYLENIRVDEELRNPGIGMWALNEIFRANEFSLAVCGSLQFIHRLSGRPSCAQYVVLQEEIDFLFTMPCILHVDWPCHDILYPGPNRSVKLEMIERVIGFFRRAGYRRVGTTQYFCCARDPAHPSTRSAVRTTPP